MLSERFFSMENEEKVPGHQDRQKPNKIQFTVDKEKFVVEADGPTASLTVRQVLEMSGNQPPEEYELIEFVGPHKQEVRHENLDEVLAVQDHARFAALFKGPTPVS